MKTRPPRALVSAAALALFASACADAPPTGPSAAAPGRRPSLTIFSSGAALVPNTVKYRDTGGRPATGRAGSAVVDALALLDREGTTTLSVAARHATEEGRTGAIEKLQVKAYTPDGQHKFTRNLHLPAPDTRVRGLVRGDEMRLQANVAGLDGERTDVVTVVETVKRLPDLTVRLAAPAEARTNLPVNVLAAVREVNGDMGTHAACELYGNGQLLDEARGMWVDAGDAVTCAFTTSFANPGAYALEVRVTPSGREWDGGNNADTATLQVHGDRPGFRTSAYFVESRSEQVWRIDEQWRNASTGQAGERVVEYQDLGARQYAIFGGHMPQRLAGPMNIRASMSTGGQIVGSLERAQLSLPSLDDWCLYEYGGPTTFQLCSGGDAGSGFSEFRYYVFTGEFTYHGREYSRVWDQLTGEELSVYYWHTTEGPDGRLFPLGADWTFSVRLGTPGGEHVLGETLYPAPSAPIEWMLQGCESWETSDYSATACYTQTDRQTFLEAGARF